MSSTIANITFIGIVVVCVAAVMTIFFRNNRRQQNGSQWNMSGYLIINILRSQIITYADNIHKMIGSEDGNDDVYRAQQITCYDILDECDRALKQAYKVDLNKSMLYVADGMTVKELMYALSACDLADYVAMVDCGNVNDVAGVINNQSGKVLLIQKNDTAQ